MTIELRVEQLVIRLSLAAFLVAAPFFAYKSLSANQPQPEKAAEHSLESAAPGRSSSDQANAKLVQLIEKTINESNFAEARWGIHVISVSDGHVLYSRNGDKLFTPASNMKLYTTAAALDLLGADYRWRTSVYADTQPNANGILHGNLVLYGRGAPDLVSETGKDNSNSLSELANTLFQKGLRRIEGNVIGDESYFRGEPIGDGWQWNDLQWYFGAEASALSVNANQVEVSVAPPEKSSSTPTIRTSDTTGYVSLLPNMAIVKSGEPFRLGIQRGLSDNRVRVWGEFPSGSKGYGAQLAVHNPALWTTLLFIDALKKLGITVGGQAVTRDWRVPATERFDPTRSTELAFVTGKNLLEITKATNKQSINLNAELILRTLGRERGSISDSSPGRERGDEESGAAVIRLWLERNGVPVKGLAIHDGSGLSRLDLVTPEATSGLLLAMWRTNSGQMFRETLPAAATDGTLRGRLKGLEKQLAAKTGALTYDNSLSGYLVAKSGETFAFSIMCNDQTAPGSSIRVIDQIAEILASHPNFEPDKGKK
ncbi:MAG TPA: D-alanyl-D-alanine carboxypeptidase/D-alanyl-D-alanine-endopeptidase [Pyrinomonadaceae bacterium]|nr:D-alanyl-D-alanine carboxypeptidase/D-alanyl-D-alanine-endopeptidase [Pyrinomonadaceae bacterium]